MTTLDWRPQISGTVVNNEPQVSDVLVELTLLPADILGRLSPDGGATYPLIATKLADAISWVQEECTTSFNGTWLPPYGVDYESALDYDYLQADDTGATYGTLADGTKVGLEKYDGNTTNQMTWRKRPITDIALLQVVTPILGYTRVYTREEIKLYARQGLVKVFTYKLAVEQALLQTVDYQAWGNLFPPLPMAVQAAFCYGFPLYDPDSTQPDNTPVGMGVGGDLIPINGEATSLDGGHSWLKGDQRDGVLNNWLANLQEAAVCHTCAQVLARAGMGRGIAQSVSFDGFSRSMSQAPFASEIASFEKRRDELIGRRKRRFTLSTVGG